MFILITYDISTQSDSAQGRLRKVAKICESYGQRVQNSVFECVMDQVIYLKVQTEINKVIDPKVDSVRYYNLGKNGYEKVKHVGCKGSLNLENTLIF